MGDSPEVKLTKLEMEVMEALWRLGSASVRELQEALTGEKQPAYTTIQTIVQRLEEKGVVRREKKISNAYIFAPVMSRKAMFFRLIDDLMDLFGETARPLMAHLVESRKLSLDDVRALEESVEKIAAERDKSESEKKE